MDDQVKEPKAPETEYGEPTERQEDQLDKFKETTEKLWLGSHQFAIEFLLSKCVENAL